MKTTLFILIQSLLTFSLLAQSETASLDPAANPVVAKIAKSAEAPIDAEAAYLAATQLAKGQLLAFINQEVHYPEAFRDQYLEGTIVLDFWIDQDGKVVQTKVMEGITDAFDEAIMEKVKALRQLRMTGVKYIGANRLRIPIEFTMY